MTDMLDNGFDAFWAAYPRKEAKKDARKAWPDALKVGAVDEIIAGIAVVQRKERKFMPLPATYLRGERWTDEDESAPKPFNEGMRDIKRQMETERLRKDNHAHMMRDLAAHAKKHEYIKKEG